MEYASTTFGDMPNLFKPYYKRITFYNNRDIFYTLYKTTNHNADLTALWHSTYD